MSDSPIEPASVIPPTHKEVVQTSFHDWAQLKIDYMSSDINEIKRFLQSRNLPVDDYTYKCTRGWRRDKMEKVKQVLYQAEKRSLDSSIEKLEEKIKRRSGWWRSIQQVVVRKLLTTDADGKQVYRDDLTSEELFFLAKTYDIAVKGERLEDGQPTVVEKIDQVNTHTFSFEELSPDAFEALDEEMSRALTPHDHIPKDSVPRDEVRGASDETLPAPLLPQSSAS